MPGNFTAGRAPSQCFLCKKSCQSEKKLEGLAGRTTPFESLRGGVAVLRRSLARAREPANGRLREDVQEIVGQTAQVSDERLGGVPAKGRHSGR